MAAAPLYNKPVTCLCDNPVEYHCNTCGDTLCSKCKAIHQKSKATSHHSIVPYGERLRPEHISSMSCPDHKAKDCTFWCQKCGKAACTDCVTSTHSSHTMIKLEKILKEKTAVLQRELAYLESNEMKEWKDFAAEARQSTANYLDKVNRVERELDTRAKEFHAKVDEIFRASKKQLQDIKKTDVAILHQQEKTASDGLEKVQHEIKECEDQLRNGSMERLLKYEEKQEGMRITLPKISPVMPPTFTPSQIDCQSLEEMFGKLTRQNLEQMAENQTMPKDTVKATEKGKISPSQGATPTEHGNKSTSETCTPQGSQKSPQQDPFPTLPQGQLIPKPPVQSSFDIGFNSYNQPITCVGSGQAWVRTGDSRLQLMDQHGTVKDTIHAEFNFHDVVVSPQGELLLSDTSNCIKSISQDKVISTLFRTQWRPFGLCCLHSGDVAVTFYSEGRVVIYSRSGNIIQELDKKLFTYPSRVAQNKVNNDLIVCDESSKKVVALDATYHLRYEYKGQGNINFYPMDLCTDSAGRVLITDYDNNRVHILDRDRRFLQYILTGKQGLWGPVNIDADSEGNTWIVEKSGKVKVAKYLLQ